jgi:sarcosine oxidase subunit gamma
VADLAHRLAPLFPLGGRTPRVETIGPVRVEERMDVALASLAARLGREAEVEAKAGEAGIPLPGPGRAEQGATWGAFWLGPSQWMIEAPFASHEDVVARLKPVFGDAGSITEQTDAWARLDVEGPLAPLMERLCNLDLAAFGPGSATRTLMEHMGVLAVRRAPDRLTLLVGRSSAGSLHHALVTAARSVF